MLEAEVKKISGKPCKTATRVSEKKRKIKKRSKKAAPDLQLTLPNIHDVHTPAGRFLRSGFTLEGFVVGDSNDFAYSAALALAEGSDPNNSLFLFSNSGMGKSHLSQAVGHHVLSNFPSDKVYYITAEDFMNEMVHAFRNNEIEQFKKRYRSRCDVLLLEDVHFLTGKERTQIELALSLDYLFDAEKKIIFTSSCSPADIPKLNEQLRSRISSGIVSAIEPPDFQTRLKILERKAKEHKCKIPGDIADYLAAELLNNVRQLESGLVGIAAKSSLLGRPIDIGLAKSVVQNITHQQTNKISVEEVKETVCKYYNLSVKELVSRSRKKSIAWPRKIAIYLARRYTEQPLQTIGKSFSRYHTTVIHSFKAVENELRCDAVLKRQVAYLCNKIEAELFKNA